MNIGIITASTRPNRNGGQVGRWVSRQAEEFEGLSFTALDLRDINLPFLNEPDLPSQGDYQHDHTAAWSEQVASCDGFIIVTPEYNHGYPASIKNALDSIYGEWADKPVGFVGYGVVGGTRAIEQLIPVVTQLFMHPLGGQVNIPLFSQLDENGDFVPNESNNKALDALLERMKSTLEAKLSAGVL